jgi:hypothetical protein
MSKNAPNITPKLTHAQLLLELHYDPETGVFTRLWRSGKRTTVCRPVQTGYPRVSIGGEELYAHRIAWFYVHREWPPHEVDHVDSDSNNNRLSNLRLATASENRRNMRETGRSAAGLKGVTWIERLGKWAARIKFDGITTHLGLFWTAEEGHAAYCAAAKEYFGEFARFK